MTFNHDSLTDVYQPFKIEGLVSSPFGDGRKKDFLKIIDLYEKDLPKLKQHAKGFPSPDALRKFVNKGLFLKRLLKDTVQPQKVLTGL